jgi:hypothetical protein
MGTPARAGVDDHYDILLRQLDVGATMGTFRFDTPPWQFGDRAGYRCAWGFLMSGGVQVARVQFDRGQSYTQVNDAFGHESNNDFSQCLPQGQERETKPKPAGLGDTIVEFRLGGAMLWSMTFPATSPTDSDSWWELEEGDDHEVEVELYWRNEVAAIATITSLTKAMEFSVRSTAPPALAAFAPTSGPVGTTVDITGANLIGATGVAFNGTPAQFTQESASEVVATVPSGATTGPITVATPAGTVTSAGAFTVTVGAVDHASSVSLSLTGHLVASGRVQVSDGASGCLPGRTVTVERRVQGSWRAVGTDSTSTSGAYRLSGLRDLAGPYRARVAMMTLPNGDRCLSDTSRLRQN